MSRKSKGINAERELIRLFEDTNKWSACRVAGSGSSRYPSPDIIAASVDAFEEGYNILWMKNKRKKKDY